MYGTFFAAKTRHIALGQQQCESKLASAWYQEINDVLGKSQEKEDEEKKMSGAEQKSCPAVECHDVVWESEVLAADCELDVMGVRAPAGVDTDDYESMVLSGKMTNSDEVLGNAVLEKPLDCTMAERTNNTACPRVLVPDVVRLLSDGDSLFDDDDGDIPFEGAPTTSDHLAIFSTATATGRCQQQTRTCEIREEPAATAMDRCRQHQQEPTRIQCGLGTEIRQKPMATRGHNTRNDRWGVPGRGCHRREQEQPGSRHFGSHFEDPNGGHGRGGIRAVGCDIPYQNWQNGAGGRGREFGNARWNLQCERGRGLGGRRGFRVPRCGRDEDFWRAHGRTRASVPERGGMYSVPAEQLHAGRMVRECGAIGQWRFDDGRGQGRNCGRMSFDERRQEGCHNFGRMSNHGSGMVQRHDFGRMSNGLSRGLRRHNFGRTSNDGRGQDCNNFLPTSNYGGTYREDS